MCCMKCRFVYEIILYGNIIENQYRVHTLSYCWVCALFALHIVYFSNLHLILSIWLLLFMAIISRRSIVNCVWKLNTFKYFCWKCIYNFKEIHYWKCVLRTRSILPTEMCATYNILYYLIVPIAKRSIIQSDKRLIKKNNIVGDINTIYNS